MKLVIIGGVAGGATAAARARRVSEAAEITVVERGPYVSYANCGLPYFISRDIESRQKLLLQTPQGFDRRYRVKVLVETEAVEIDRAGKRVRVRRGGEDAWLPYDKLVLAQGGNPVVPSVPGVPGENVFRFWNVPDMDRLDGFIESARPRSALVVGGGFVGLEMAEAFRRRGLATTVIELLPTVMPHMDRELGVAVGGELRAHGVEVVTGAGVAAVHGDRREVELSDGRRLPADLVLFSVGVRPELGLARAAGLEVGPAGGLRVDDRLRTSDPDILAVGDMIEVCHRVSGRTVRVPLAGPANRQGRLAATNALGGDVRYRGALATSAVKVFEATAAMTGLTERAAREAGLAAGAALVYKDHHAGYYPGAKELLLKLVYERGSGRLLGAQAFGHAGVEKRIDVLATALHGGMTLHDLAELDLAYAPPFSSANDPVNVAAFVGENDLSGFAPLLTAAELRVALASPAPPVVLDVRTDLEWSQGHLRGALHVPLDDLRARWDVLPRGRRIAVHCKSGFRAHLALRILRERGFEDVVNVTGGWLAMQAEGGFEVEAAGPARAG
ncbi:MAG TPA: FAD-dependent oxidoreductase [Anaeromyxobacteraceae bacterium]|nr:FAD-dependent oxidoreductase [Anaeromyxobacteraceae bacterium]